MHCPKCGQQQISEETRFCSKCGFLLTGISQVIANEGLLPGHVIEDKMSARKRGVLQGLFIFLLSFLIVPIVTIITIFANAEPFAVVISTVLLVAGGFLRMAYALMFESAQPGAKTFEENAAATTRQLWGRPSSAALPGDRSIPATAYKPPSTGSWLDTNDLPAQTRSVTDSTTKLLKHDE
jgi:hypothetical protein